MAKEILHIYTRVSTHAQQEKGTSLDSQKELGIKKAKQLGFAHKVWNEGGASSNYEDFENRPELSKLLAEIDTGNIKHLWVYNNDRLSRNDITAHVIRMALQRNSVILYTENGEFNLNNPHDKLMKTLFDGIAQYDNAARAERTRLGKLNRVKQGFWMGGSAVYGYQIKDKKLVLHLEESKWIKQIYEWYNNDKSTEWIKSELDKAGVETRRNKGLWSLGSIQKILQNTHPAGYYIYVDSKTDETVKCTCPAIVSKTLWNACQEKRKKIYARKGQNNRTKRFYLLRNLMYCGHCGSHMSGRIKESKNEYFYYCPRKERNWVKSASKKDKKWQRGKGCSMVRSLNIKATDELVTGEVFKIIFDQKRLYALIQEHLKQDDSSDEGEEIETKKLKNKQKRLTKELDNVIANIADVETNKILGKKDERVSERILGNLNMVLNETESKIEQCKVRLNELQNEYRILEITRKLNYNPTTLTVDINKEQKQAYLKKSLNRIDVSYDQEKCEHKLIIRFKLPLVNNEKNLTFYLKKNRKNA